MNVTELARRLRIPTNEVRELLPLLGYDIGRKAIKVNDKVAFKIIDKIRANPDILDQVRSKLETEEEEIAETVVSSDREIKIPPDITVSDFAALLEKPVTTIIQELMKNGILANLNEQIDYETASIIAQDLGFSDVKPLAESQDEKEEKTQNELQDLTQDDPSSLKDRPPVIVVMGHVDHGKTKLLDTIKKTNVIDQEAGGITQHIGAYQVTKNDRLLTFIDTPGHEAFTAMRSRGARVADIAILLIAADDGIKPQTEEALQIIQNAKIPFIVAMNKIDKPEADPEKVKQQLAQKNVLAEDWGGKIAFVPVSAKTGKGIDDLLEQLVLLADVEKESIQANPDRPAVCSVIESHLDKGEGPVTTAIVLAGTLKQGDAVQVGNMVGKIRAMKDFKGSMIKQAEPSMPVRILGLKHATEVGDIIQVVVDRKKVKKLARDLQYQKKAYRDKTSMQLLKSKSKSKEITTVDIILKTDTIGSQEALLPSLETLGTDTVKVQIAKKGLGNFTEADVIQAENTDILLYGFNVKVNQNAAQLADERGVTIHTFKVIYELLDHIEKETQKHRTYETETIELGTVKIMAVFRTEKKSMIVGGQVSKGKIELNAKATIKRNDKVIGKGKITMLQQAKQEVKSVPAGTECGVQFEGPPILQENDILEVFTEEIKDE